MEGSKGREKKDFESSWADRFANAESAPSDHIWKNISGELANQEVGSYKKRILYYRWAAAASLLMAFMLGVLYYTDTPNQQDAAYLTNTQSARVEEAPSDIVSSNDNEQNNPSQRNNANTSVSTLEEGTTKSSPLDVNDQSTEKSSLALTSAQDTETVDPAEPSMVTTIPIASLAQDRDEQSIFSDFQGGESLEVKEDFLPITPLASLNIQALGLASASTLPERIYGVPIYGNAEKNEEENDNEVLWAGLNLGSGSFDPNYGPPTGNLDEAAFASEDALAPALDANTAGLPLREESNSGPSLAIGIDVGKSVGKRWVLQTGLRYGRYRVNTNTNLVFSSENQTAVPLSFQNREALFSEEEVTVSSENLDVDNNFQLLTVPVKAGFVLIDKKFNVLLNAGLASDWYLGNSLNSSSDEFARYNINPGSDSPYRRVHLSGITSVQLGYKIMGNYYLSVEPNYRKSITDFAKTGNSFSSRPSGLGLIVGFRYLFR